MSDPLDLSGEWDGVFNYPRALPPRGFRATLRDQGGALTGETVEESDGADAGATLVALIDGRRDGTRVRFAKRYDALARAHYAVTYEGAADAEAQEIAGRWTIPGVWSGTFLMVRRPGRALAVLREASETVR